jgi:hypothetical protein
LIRVRNECGFFGTGRIGAKREVVPEVGRAVGEVAGAQDGRRGRVGHVWSPFANWNSIDFFGTPGER